MNANAEFREDKKSQNRHNFKIPDNGAGGWKIRDF